MKKTQIRTKSAKQKIKEAKNEIKSIKEMKKEAKRLEKIGYQDGYKEIQRRSLIYGKRVIDKAKKEGKI